MRQLQKLLPILLVIAIASACRSSKEAVDQYRYFDKHLDTLNTLVNQMKEPVILQGDQLDIQVYSGSLNQDQVKVFVLGSTEKTGYMVDAEGNINMPVLGKIKVEGLDKPAVEKILLQKLEPFVKNPVVNIMFLNFKVLTLGEVRTQGFQTMNEKSTVLDAIGQAGGLSDAGKRTDILLIRQLPQGKKTYTRLNLNDASIFASPFFQLQQNDIIYALPNDSKLIQFERANNPLFRDLPVYLTLFTSVVSILTVVLLFTR